MKNSNAPKTERRHYQQDSSRNDWVSKNDTGDNFINTNDLRENNYFDDDGLANMNQTISAVSKPIVNYTTRPGHRFLNFGNGSSIPDFKIKTKPGSRIKKNSRRSLRQSLQKAYNQNSILDNTGTKFNLNMKKRKNGNIFSSERTINFDSGVKIDRSIIPRGGMSYFVSPNNSGKISSTRMQSNNEKKKPGENVFMLKRQINDLRELLKERDDQILSQKMTINLSAIQNATNDRESLMNEVQKLKDYINIMHENQGEPDKKFKDAFKSMQRDLESTKKQLEQVKNGTDNTFQYKEKYEALLASANAKHKHLSDMIREKDKLIQDKEKLIEQKDKMIATLQTQVKAQPKAQLSVLSATDIQHVDLEKKHCMKEQRRLKSQDIRVSHEEKDDQMIVREFFVRLANFLLKKNLTLYSIIHNKIYDKVFSGVETELITANHFWRLIHKVNFMTIAKEREIVTNICKHKSSVPTPKDKMKGTQQNFTEIFEVKVLAKILSQLGIVEDIPKSTKNFNYENLNGCGIRIINKIVREMHAKKIEDVAMFLGSENIETKEIVAGDKSEQVEIITADNFLKVLRSHGILKRWEDLDENLQTFLGITQYHNEQLMIRKIRKCTNDFQNCEFFEYYGFEMRKQEDIDSDDEPDDFNILLKMKNRLMSLRKQKTIMK